MMDFIMVPAVMTIITLGVYKLFELFVCKKERIMYYSEYRRLRVMFRYSSSLIPVTDHF